jgi:hypothetical protein
LFLFVIIAGQAGHHLFILVLETHRFQGSPTWHAIKTVGFPRFPQASACAASIRCSKNNFEKFSAMLAGAQKAASDAGNLVSS